MTEKKEVRDLTECHVCHQFVDTWTQLPRQPLRCQSCLGRALEEALARLDECDWPRKSHPLPPPPCTGAGLVPPLYQGMTMASSAAFEPAPCAICGQVVAVDGFMKTVNHPYRIIDGAP